MSYTSRTNYRSIKNYSGGRGMVSSMRSNSIRKNYNNINNSSDTSTNESSASKVVLKAELKTYSKIADDSADNIQKIGAKLTAVGENSLFGRSEKADTNKQIVNEATDFIKNYNNMLSSITKLGGTDNKKYASELKEFADANKDAFKAIGITVLKDGSLTINKKELESASIEDLKKVFNGDSSFAGKVTKLSEDIEKHVETKLKENLQILNGANSSNKTSTARNSSGSYFNMYV